MNEEWKSVHGWPGYEVSNMGRVRSLDRTSTNAAGVTRQLRGRILRQVPNSDGYLTVTLHGPSMRRTAGVSRLVAEAFLGGRQEGLVVCHGDGDKNNNAATNLRYDTVIENNRDRLRHGTNPQRAKTHCPAGHAYDKANTRWDRNGWRICRTCSRRRDIARYYANKTKTIQETP